MDFAIIGTIVYFSLFTFNIGLLIGADEKSELTWSKILAVAFIITLFPALAYIVAAKSIIEKNKE